MYRTYWGLRQNPFASTYDPRFFFMTEDQEVAVRQFLEVYTENKAVMMLLGPVGVGKTYLCKLIASQLNDVGVKIAHMITPRLNAEMFCHEVARKLGLPGENDYGVCAQDLYDRMSDCGGNCPAVLILDEAQTITDEMTFEAIRIMLDFDKNGRILHTLLMSGQDSLVQRLRSHKSLNQRIVIIVNIYERSYACSGCKFCNNFYTHFTLLLKSLLYDISW